MPAVQTRRTPRRIRHPSAEGARPVRSRAAPCHRTLHVDNFACSVTGGAVYFSSRPDVDFFQQAKHRNDSAVTKLVRSRSKCAWKVGCSDKGRLMNHFRIGRFGRLAFCAAATVLAACSTTVLQNRSVSSANDLAGRTICTVGGDGKAVNCGPQAEYCLQSPDGTAVNCGGLAQMCLLSRDGSAVACGGRAPFCLKTKNGAHVACGGMAPYCEHNSDGSETACGRSSSASESWSPTEAGRG